MSAAETGAGKRVHIETYGCQMNVYDSERIKDVLAAEGYAPAQSASDADLVVLNTCHIREKATEKVYSEIGRLRRRIGAAPPRIVVAGCVAQAEGEEILRRAPDVALVVGPQAYQDLPGLLRAPAGRVAADFAPAAKFRALPARRAAAPSAFLSIQEGCDKFCAFCVVPYTRGAEYSRPAQEILAEAAALARQGVRELVLLGQNVNAYHGASPAQGALSLAGLLHELAQLEGVERLRFTTSHPKDMDDALIAAFAEQPKLMPYLHLPVQSGSDRILRAMNRKHTAAHYTALIGRLRAARPDLALSTDIIVGFPGETEADFEETLALVRSIGFASAYSFKYSPRPGTPAALLAAQVDEAVKADRLTRLQAILAAQQLAFNESKIGQTLPVLVERAGAKPGQMRGRSPFLQGVYFEAASEWAGRVAPVRIRAATQNALAGELVAVPA